jgi:hypothetical protein
MFFSTIPHNRARFDQVCEQPFIEEYILPTTAILGFPMKHFSHERWEILLVFTRKSLFAILKAY